MTERMLVPMMKDIYEQPELICRSVCWEKNGGTADFVKLFVQRRFERVFFCGSGSVATAAYVLHHIMRKMMKVEAYIAFSGILLRHGNFDFPGNTQLPHTLLICPAETGYTRGPVELARRAKKQSMCVVATARDQENCLARESDVVIQKLSGTECALPSTKGYTMGILQLTMCITDAALATGKISKAFHQQFYDSVGGLQENSRKILKSTQSWYNRTGMVFERKPVCRIIGYGVNYGTAMEGALKFEEAFKIMAKAYELEEFLHGPVGAVFQEDVIMFLFAEMGVEYERMAQLFNEMKSVTNNCIAIGNVPTELADEKSLCFDVSENETLNPIELILPLQVIACRAAYNLKIDTTKCVNASVKEKLRPSF